jgi:hypothetical protein
MKRARADDSSESSNYDDYWVIEPPRPKWPLAARSPEQPPCPWIDGLVEDVRYTVRHMLDRVSQRCLALTCRRAWAEHTTKLPHSLSLDGIFRLIPLIDRPSVADEWRSPLVELQLRLHIAAFCLRQRECGIPPPWILRDVDGPYEAWLLDWLFHHDNGPHRPRLYAYLARLGLILRARATEEAPGVWEDQRFEIDIAPAGAHSPQ